jgi:glycyl-tRNA synthetase beta chain
MASATASLLVELFVEELPPKSLARLSESFAEALAAGLRARGLTGDSHDVVAFGSPRRLGALVRHVAAQAADRTVSHKLMPASVGLAPDGSATPALQKKLAALGAGPQAVASLRRAVDGKAEALFLDAVQSGVTLAAGLQQSLDEAIEKLPIAKVMTYQLADGWTDVRFVRPVHALVALHGDEVVDVQALGLRAGRETRGHRFEAAVDPIALQSAESYPMQLREEGGVIASFAERRAEISRQLARVAAQSGGTPVDDPALLDEVTALVERPNVLLGQFDSAFLEVPQECLILTMKANQKYFPLLDNGGRLTNRFLIVSNIRPADPGAVIGGNERVVRPRLADARFFYDQDRKRTLASRVEGLSKVVYHGKLGTQGERVARVRAIAGSIGRQLGGEALARQADRAAELAKADLLTDMVGEFPELQGVMGGYYARHDGEPDAVAQAIEDHYRPRFAGDALPRGDVGTVVALADKLETLVGLFGIGQVPSGDKDPFALRRHALGVVRMLVEKSLPLDVPLLLDMAVPPFGGSIADPTVALAEFVYERFAGSLREQGFAAQEIDAVLSLRPPRLADVPARLSAVRAFAELPEAASLAAANKRVGNILRKADAPVAPGFERALLRDDAERALVAALADVEPASTAAFQRGDYTASLRALAALKAPVDTFFDRVMVNAEDRALRANRLGLLATLHAAMNRVADLSRLAA